VTRGVLGTSELHARVDEDDSVMPDFSLNWYGERGIVNALVVHISSSPAPLQQIQGWLGAIRWASGSSLAWTQKLLNAEVFVEIGLADFGKPDVILICTDIELQKRLIFIEAKAGPYVFSAKSNTIGMKDPGFNSSINGQLSLKYRFACALGRTAPLLPSGEVPAGIVEPAQLKAAYSTSLNDKKVTPRRLLKPGIVRDMFAGRGLLGHAETHCFYVALTRDRHDRMSFTDFTILKEDLLPRFINDKGEDMFPSMLNRVGWLGYHDLANACDLNDDSRFMSAVRTMASSLEPDDDDYMVGAGAKVSGEALSAAGRIIETLFAGKKIMKFRGSYSVLDGGMTVAKIIPRSDAVFVGVRESLSPSNWFPGPLKTKSVRGKKFLGVDVPVDVSDLEEAHRLASGMGWT
jgi:hypothetical protein